MKYCLSTFLIFLLYSGSIINAQETSDNFKLKKLGTTIYEGVFTGNGLLGSMTYLKSANSIRVDVGRTDVFDHRQNGESLLFDKARMNIGHIEISLSDSIQKSNGEINYKEAEALANIYVNENQGLQIRALTFAHRNVIYVEVARLGGYKPKFQLKWVPEEAKSPRLDFNVQLPKNYPPNPKGTFKDTKGLIVYDQSLLAGGGYATVLRKETIAGKEIYLISIGYDTSSKKYVDEAIASVTSFPPKKTDEELKQHRKWWTDYNNTSRLNFPDIRLQQFYDMQLYKLGSATRSGKPALDLQGPWTAKTPWPAYWHNLNIQLTYSPTFVSNHLGIAASLIEMIDRNTQNLIDNVPQIYRHNSAAIGRSSGVDMKSRIALEKGKHDIPTGGDGIKELGNLTWMLQSYYQYYRSSMDAKAYDKLFPLLKRAINYYLHLLEKNEEDKYHISVKTYSPEYPKAYVYDTNYDLSILRWGLKTLISLDNERGGKDPLHAKWIEVLNNLVDYPKNADGYMIGKDFPYELSHRHYSHLLMIYPFYEINWDQQENRDLITKSIKHWQSKPKSLQGYSFSGAASMYAMMGKGDDALRSLNTLLDKYVKPNTLYAETGPVIETPLAAAASIQELFLQYWDGTVHIFPAVPTAWKDVSFKDFLTDGAFVISANRKEGKTREILVKSKHTGNIKLKTGIINPVVLFEGKGSIKHQQGDNVVIFLAKGATARISQK